MCCQGLCWGHTSVPLHACCPTQCLHRAARGCLWGGWAGLSCRGEGKQKHHAAGLGPQNHPGTQLAAALSSPCPPMLLPGATYAALSLPLLNRMGEKTQLTNSWVVAKNTLFFPYIVPTDNKLCVVMAAHEMQVFLHTLKQLLNSASLSP